MHNQLQKQTFLSKAILATALILFAVLGTVLLRSSQAAPGDPLTNQVLDLNGDGSVGVVDLSRLLSQWNGPGTADFNNDGLVGIVDMSQLLAQWGHIADVNPPTVAFFDDFTDPEWEQRYEFGITHRDDFVLLETSWTGDHRPVDGGSDPDTCTGPTESRTIQRGERPAFNDDWIYRCAPGDDVAKAHIMTSIGDTSGYSVGGFAPRQTFSDITEVSWDVNITNLLGRQWVEVAIVPAANFSINNVPCRTEAFPCDTDGYDALGAVGFVIENPVGYTRFRAVSPEHPSGDPWSSSLNDDGVHEPCSTADVPFCFDYGLDPDDPANQSKATRRTFAMSDNGDDTITFSIEQQDGSMEDLVHPTAFPDGPVRVVFKDHNYTPDKDGVPVGHTWHWDNISIR